MMEAVLGTIPPALAARAAALAAGLSAAPGSTASAASHTGGNQPSASALVAARYFTSVGGLNWPDGASSRKSVKAVKRLCSVRQLAVEQGA